jgi:hypothetical protein
MNLTADATPMPISLPIDRSISEACLGVPISVMLRARARACALDPSSRKGRPWRASGRAGIDDVSLLPDLPPLFFPLFARRRGRSPSGVRSCLVLALAAADLPAVSCHHRRRREASAAANMAGGSAACLPPQQPRPASAPSCAQRIGVYSIPAPSVAVSACQDIEHIPRHTRGVRWKYLGRICDQMFFYPPPLSSFCASRCRHCHCPKPSPIRHGARPPGNSQPLQRRYRTLRDSTGSLGGLHVECTAMHLHGQEDILVSSCSSACQACSSRPVHRQSSAACCLQKKMFFP